MRTIRIKAYKFDELSDQAKEKVLEANYDINLMFDWWESVYMDAENVGINITGFDTDRGSYCDINLKWDALEVARTIIKEHGETCDTYQLAKTFLADYDKLVEKHSDGITLNVVAEDNEYDFDQDADELESEFENDLSSEYLSMLRQEYEYLGSKEAVQETIEVNEYEFTKEGKRI